MARLPNTASNYGSSKGAGKSGTRGGAKSGSKGAGKSGSKGAAKSGKPAGKPDPFGLGTKYGVVAPNPIIPKPGGKGHFPVRPDPRHPGKPPAKPPATKSAPPKPAPPARVPVSPFLTPTQQAALSSYDTKYGYDVGALGRKVSDATADTNQGLATNLHTHDVNTDNANQSMAARGLFQSSIRDSDLNDIDATLTTRNNTLNTNLNRLTLDTNSQLDRLGTDWATTHNLYNGLAVANAAAQPPAANPPATTPGKPGATGPETTTHNMQPSGPETVNHREKPIASKPPGKLQTGTGIIDPLAGGKRYGAMQPAAANLARTRMGAVQ